MASTRDEDGEGLDPDFGGEEPSFLTLIVVAAILRIEVEVVGHLPLLCRHNRRSPVLLSMCSSRTMMLIAIQVILLLLYSITCNLSMLGMSIYMGSHCECQIIMEFARAKPKGGS